MKAYYRRGSSYSSSNKLEMAIKDFQFILEKEPDNKFAIKDLMEARNKLNQKLEQPKS